MLLIFLMLTSPIAAFAQAPVQAGPPAAALSLQDCVQLALASSPDLESARQKLIQSRALVWEAVAPFSPQDSFTANQTQLGYDATGRLNKGNRWNPTTYTTALNATWNVFNSFRDWDHLKGARADSRAAQEALAAARQLLIFQTVQAYFGQLAADRSIDVQKENLRSKQEHLELARARYRAGVRSYSDVLNAQIQMKQTEIDLVSAQSQSRSAVIALNILLGRPVSATTAVQDDLGFQPTKEDLDEFVKTAFAKRPEVLQAVDELDSAKAARAFAIHDALPALSVGGLWNYSPTSPPLGVAPGAPVAGLNPFWQVNLGVSVPFWDGGTRIQEARRTLAGVRAQEANVEKVKRSVEGEVADAYLALERNQQVHDIARDQVSAARDDLKIVSERYRNGAASFLEVVDAEANLLNVQLAAIQSLYNFHIARFQLKRAAGLEMF